jgi:prepilin signal peptidase PulO-like enzyme (type II secretory pathway)
VFGWQLFLVNFMLAIFLGTLVSIFLLLGTDKTLKSRVPFGTFLSVAAVATLFWGPGLLHWYLSYLGL